MSIGNSILFVAVVLIGLALTWHQARSGRQVAAQVLESNAAVAAQAAETAKANRTALQAIHTLVNSNLTAAQQGELNATRRDLASLRELASFKEAQGFPTAPETTESIETTQNRVRELEREVGQKQKQTAVADATARRQTEEQS